MPESYKTPRRVRGGVNETDTRWILLGSHHIDVGALRDALRRQDRHGYHDFHGRNVHGQYARDVVGGQLELSARALMARIRPGPAEEVFPRVYSRHAAPGLLDGGMPGPQPLQEGSSRMHPDGSASFGGHAAFGVSVDTQARTGAIDPHTGAVISLSRGQNGFMHKSAMSALSVPGTRQGTLDPESGDAVDTLEDFACRSLEKNGVYPNRVFCSRPTARRLLAGAGGLGGGAIPLTGTGGISITTLPLENNVLHMMDPLDRLLCTDGGMAMGYTLTRTGYDLAMRVYREFAVTGASLAMSGSAGTWDIPPPAEDSAAASTDTPPCRPGAMRRPGKAPREGAPMVAAGYASPCRKTLPPLTGTSAG